MPENFLNFLLYVFISKKEYFFAIEKPSKEIISEFIETIQFFHFITLLDYSFYKYTSAAVAVSIIIISRCVLKLNDPWPKEMAEFTGIQALQVKECVKLLNERFQNKFIQNVFNNLEKEIENKNFLILAKSNLNLEILSQNYFMNKKCVQNFIRSLETIASFRKSNDKL